MINETPEFQRWQDPKKEIKNICYHSWEECRFDLYMVTGGTPAQMGYVQWFETDHGQEIWEATFTPAYTRNISVKSEHKTRREAFAAIYNQYIAFKVNQLPRVASCKLTRLHEKAQRNQLIGA